MNPFKRSFDIVFSLVLGIVLLPLFAAIAVGLKATSPGALLFRQDRLGRGGVVFKMNKFRKFPADWGTQGPGVTLQHDVRMTGIGQFLERTKLDELPQLWNIFVGEMSFVGPRPEIKRFQHLFTGNFKDVLDYVPGIFGPNQAKYRNESAMYPHGVDPEAYYEDVLFPDKANRDIEYFKNSSFLSDIRWIVTGTFALIFSVVIWRRSTKSTVILCCYDIMTIMACWLVAHFLKFGVYAERASDRNLFFLGLIVLPVVAVVVFAVARIYRNPARYFSETDFYRLTGTVCVVWITSAMVMGFLFKSTSSLLLAASCVLSILLMSAPRIAYQLFWKKNSIRQAGKKLVSQVNIVVCGVNNQSVELCSLLNYGFPRANVLGLIDLDQDLVRREISGFEVLGTFSDLDVLHARHSIHYVWVSTEVGEDAQVTISDWCKGNQVGLVAIKDESVFTHLLTAQVDTHTTSISSERRGALVKSKEIEDTLEAAL